jgi:hypothetical protein
VGGKPVAFVHRHGKGQVAYVGREVFRLRNSERAERRKLGGDELVQWLTRLACGKETMTWAESIRQGMTTAGFTGPVAWFRDPAEQARGAAYFRTPYPTGPNEKAAALHLDMGRGEYETFPIYVTTPKAMPAFTVAVEDLKGPAGTIPGGRFRVRIMGLARPDLTVGTFWLIDPPPGAPPAFALEPHSTSTFWFTFDTRGVEPGEYRGAILLGEQRVALTVTVHPVEVPGREFFAVQATHMWNSFGADPRQFKQGVTPDLAKFHRHMDNMAAHYVSYAEDVYWTLGVLDNALVRADGEVLSQAIQAKRVKLDALPALDLSALNPLVDAGVARDMAFFHAMMRNGREDWLKMARAIGVKDIEANGPEHRKVKEWLIGQVADYLHSRGIRRIISAIGDEISPDEIEGMNLAAEALVKQGVMPLLTITGMIGTRRDLLLKLRPSIGVWVWNAQIMPDCLRFVREHPDTIKPGDLMLTYTADWHQASYVRNRQRGAYYAWLGLNGWFIHGYLRWYPNGGAVFGGPDGPIDTEGWEGARDGIEDARYLARLRGLCQSLADHPQAGPLAQQWRQRMDGIFGEGDDALVRLDEHRHDYNVPSYGGQWQTRWQTPRSDITRLRQAKRLLLEGLTALQAFDKPPQLRYADLPLATDRRLAVKVEGDAKACAEMRRLLAQAAATRDLPDGEPRSRLVLGDESSSPAVADAMRLGTLGVTPRYPAKGDFIIAVQADARPLPTVFVYARDDEGRRRGVEQLVRLVERVPTLRP